MHCDTHRGQGVELRLCRLTLLALLFAPDCSVSQGALFAFATFFPPKYTQAMLVGQAVAGLAVSLASIFTDLVGPDDRSCIPDMDPHMTQFLSIHNHDEPHQGVRSAAAVEAAEGAAESSRVLRSLDAEASEYTTDWETLAYFVIAVGVLLSCLVTYPMLERLPLAKYYAQPGGQSAAVGQYGGDADGGETVNGSWGEVCDDANGNDASMGSGASRAPSGTQTFNLLATKNLLREGQDSSVVEKEEEQDGPVVEKSGLIHGLRVRLAPISRYAFSVFLVFMITLALFPGATSKIVSRIECRPGRPRFFSRDTFTLFSFVSFNVFDILGRVVSSVVALPDAWLPTAALSRSLFLVLFLGCRSESTRTRTLFTSDAFPIVIMPLFGFTNGYVATRAMMAGSRYGPWAATAMTMSLLCGLLAGSLLSFLVLYLSTGSIN